MLSKIKNLSNRNPGRRFFLLLVPLLILLTLIIAVSCTSSGTGSNNLEKNEKLWKAQGLKNYDYTIERQSFSPEDWRGPVNIQVRGGVAVSVTYVSSGAVVTEGKFANVDTIDKLFTILSNAYAGTGDFNQKAEKVDVTYDTRRGYPVNFYIDVSSAMADEEVGYTVTNLVVK